MSIYNEILGVITKEISNSKYIMEQAEENMYLHKGNISINCNNYLKANERYFTLLEIKHMIEDLNLEEE